MSKRTRQKLAAAVYKTLSLSADWRPAFFEALEPRQLLSTANGLQQAVGYTAGNLPYAVVAGDFAHNGNADLAVVNSGSNNISILMGNGDGTFNTATNYNTGGTTPIAIAEADLNGDGYLDLVVANYSSNSITVFMNKGDGTGTFNNGVTYTVGSKPDAIGIADFNGDTKPDLVVANRLGNSVSVLLNTGSGAFGAQTTYSVGTSPYALVTGTFGTGNQSVAVANQGSNNVSVLLGTGSGTLQSKVNYATGNSPVAIAAADLTGGGTVSLVTANSTANSVSVLLGNNNGTFQNKVSYAVGTTPHAVVIADMNGDGTPDLVVANSGSNNISVLDGTGTGAFNTAANTAAGSSPFGLATGDFNGDSRTDVAVADYSSSSGNVDVVLGKEIAAQGIDINPTEGTGFTGNVATFTDTESGIAAGSYTANINWGDGTTSVGTVTATDSSFTVSGSHTYDEDGSSTVSVTITDPGGATTTGSSLATINDAPITATGTSLTVTEGQAFTGQVVGSFTDGYSGAVSGQFTAFIDWGDGTTSQGTVVSSGGGFNVEGDHTYAHAGPQSVFVTISDDGGSSDTAISTVTVENATMTPTGTTFAAVEGDLFSNEQVATFTDFNTGSINSDFTASINWGDGETTTGTVGGDNGTFTVDGTHAYSHAGADTETISIVGLGGTTITANTTATVDNATLTGTGTTITPTEGTAFTTATVATFTDANSSAYSTDFTASIVWGDGNTSAGVVSGSDGTYTVTGGNNYLHAGTDTITVSIAGFSSTITATSTASVANAVLASTGTTISKVEGTAFTTTTVATFTDANTASVSSDFTASIVWGNGDTSTGVVSGSNGTYTVKGGENYEHAGVDTLTITVTGLSGATTSVNSTASIANATLASTGASISEVEGTSFSTTTVATFTDANASASSSDFTASIVWGDGNTSSGVISGSNGTYTVKGGETYFHAGTDTLTITVTGLSGTTTSVNSTATVDNATLTPTGATITPTERGAFTTLTVATFTDSNGAASSNDFSASIVWGDGNTSAGVVSGSDGTYTVTGANNYLHAGTDTITVSIAGFSDTISATSTASVANAALTSTGVTLSGTEGTAFGLNTWATFTDANPSASFNDFTASIDWGDGTTTSGTVAGSNGSYSVLSDKTYDDAGIDTISITITGLGGSTTSLTSTATVANAALASTGTSISEVEGSAFSTTTLATFTDANASASSNDFTASIVWGDGNTSSGVVSGSNGTYTVKGGNTYDDAGTDAITVSINGGTSTTIASSTATVDNATLTPIGATITPAEGTAFTTLTVATFTDSNGAASSNDFTASIVWGDGNTSAGVVSGSDGTYTVTGGNNYLHAGTDTITVSIAGFSSTITATSTASVANAVLASTGTTISKVEGTAFTTTTIATFTDANTASVSSDFTASIAWGDGNTSAGVVSGSNGTYTVKGANTYDDPGSDTITVTVTGLGGGTTSVNSTASVANATLAGTGATITPTEGGGFTGTVGTFTDANTLGNSNDFTATIVWGDGNTSAGIVAGSDGTYTVSGVNTYAHAGTDSISISVVPTGGDTLNIGSTASVANATLAATGVTLTPTEGSPFSSTLIATFTDSNVLASSSDFSASIVWGDGNTSAGLVSGSDGTYSVTGGNDYAEEGGDAITVSIAGLGGTTITADSTATVADAAITGSSVTTDSPISLTEGAGSGNIIVAYFTDANPGATSADFTATITWGDGGSSAGTITAVDSGFAVTGSHTYLHAGSDSASISINDTGGSSTSATDSVTVANATLASTGVTITKTEDTAFSGTTVATFTDVNVSASSSDFTATIDWGDGSTVTTGTITGTNGTYTVAGDHTYVHAGSDTITVSVAGLAGGTTSVNSTATVDNAPLTGTGATLTPTAGAPFTGAVVATFTDPNASASSTDFSASIVWGDGSTTSGTVLGSNGAFSVQGDHDYETYGTDHITVTVTGFSGTTTINSTATVADAALAATGLDLTGIEGTPLTNVVVANFTDANPFATTSEFTALINWGDSNTTTGTIVRVDGGFEIEGTHTYATTGNRGVGISVTSAGGSSAVTAGFTSITVGSLGATGASPISEVEGTSFSGITLASFSDSNVSHTSSAFTASINWGDGTTSSGVVSGSSGAFSVAGSHDYLHAGSDNITITLGGTDSGAATATLSASVANAVLASTGTTLSGVEGTAFSSTTVATFTDVNASASSSDFTASIVWGNGDTSSGIVSGSNGTYTVKGTDTYFHAGTDTLTITVTGLGGGTTSVDSTATVDNATLTGTSATITPTEGSAFTSLTVATFTDANASASSSDFTASIIWGDGNTSSGVVTGSNGSYSVTGGNDYLHAGTDTITVTIAGFSSSASVTSTASVANATLASTTFSFVHTEGVTFSNQKVATFTDVNASASSSDFTASIVWGDGNTSSGVISGSNGTYTVKGGNTYDHPGTDTVTVTVVGLGGGTTTVDSTAHINHALMTGTGATLTPTEGVALSGTTVATFTDANSLGSSSDFTASIVWGDGNTSAGIISGSDGNYSVTGSNTYEHAGTDQTTISVFVNGYTFIIGGTATVDNATLTSTGTTITPTEGSAFSSLTVATFTDANASASSSDFTASIVWGDGNTSSGVVTGSNGTYSVTGGNDYLHAGTDTITVTIAGFDSNTIATSTASVANDVLASTGTTISETEGVAFSTTTVATFTDVNASASSSDFTASIVWGNGDTSSGVVSGSNGTYTVSGGDTYEHAGTDTLTITVTGLGGGTTSVNSTASIANAVLASTGTTINEVEGSAFSTTTVATFTDVNASASSSDFTASIVWGNGDTSSGVVSGSNGTYTVSGGDTYEHAGTDTLTITVTGLSGATTSVNSTATVANAALASTGKTLHRTEGIAVNNFTVATFTDANASASSSDFTASIVWGNGDTTSGVVTGSNGTYSVKGTDTYFHAGTDTLTITVTGLGGTTTSVNSTASVANAALASTGTSISETEGVAFATTTVATFTDVNASASSSDFTASIVWGNGDTSSGVVTGSNGTYTVSGGDTYFHAGADTLTITVTGLGGGTTSVNSTASIANAVLASTGTTINEVEGSAFSTTTVATFTDVNASASSSDFTASIVWGNGDTSSGVVTGSNGTYTVSGGDTYEHAGTDTITVTVTGLSGTTTSTSSTATVDNATLTSTGTTITPTEGSAFSSLTVATFTDANASASSSDFTASIVWGDGNTSSGVVTGSNGTYSVTGGNDYLHAGTDTITVTIAGFDSNTIATSTASVANDVLASTGTTISETEGVAFSTTTVATFTDVNASASSSDFTASIVWGNGDTSSGVVSGSNGTYTVSGGDTYEHAGTDTLTITVTGLGGGTTSVNSTASIANAVLASTGTTINEVEGSAFSTTTVATFTDVNASASSSDFTASIVWGNGDTSSGVVSGSNGTYTVSGGDTYEHAGTDTLTITVTGLSGATTSVNSTATVANAALASTGTTITETEGTAFSTTTVATFTDVNASASSSDFTASIVWGDGNTSSGVVTGSNGTYTVEGGNTYERTGTDTITVTVTGLGGTTTSVNSTATVDNAALAGTGATITPTEGSPFSGAVATFTDANPSASSSDFTASIVWGDGNTSSGVITGSNGTYTVSGGNTYEHAGSDTITVSINGFNGNASATSTATVGNAELTGTGVSFSTTEGLNFGDQIIAKFSDANASATSSDFTAAIHWGNGHETDGTIVADGSGFDVMGTRPYTEAGTYTVTVGVTGLGGGTATITSTATVADASLTAGTSSTFTFNEGQTFNGIVGTFIDAYTGSSSTDFTAAINWGDSVTSTGTVTGSDGTYSVYGNHAYQLPSTDTITVSIHDVGGSTATVNDSVTVAAATLTAGSGSHLTSTEGVAYSGTVGTFTSSSPVATTGEFSATINWGDSNSSSGTVTASGSSFTVTGGHTYAVLGNKTVSVSIVETNGHTISLSDSMTIGDAPIVGTAANLTATALTAMNSTTTLGTFSDANTLATSSSFTAAISWGDGTSGTGTVVSLGGGNYAVRGGHTYAGLGHDIITLSVSDLGGSSATIQSTNTVTAAAISATGASLVATSGKSFSGTVGTIVDPNPHTAIGNYTATITWADGTTSLGTIVKTSTGHYTVQGTHTYALGGSYAVGLSIVDDQGPTASVNSTLTVNDAPITATAASQLQVTRGTAFTGVVATFTDANPLTSLTRVVNSSTLQNFTATINWGDGTSSSGVITFSHGKYSVSGTHTYAGAATYAAVVSISEFGGATARATTSIWARKPVAGSGHKVGSGQPSVNYNYRNHHGHNEERRRRLDDMLNPG